MGEERPDPDLFVTYGFTNDEPLSSGPGLSFARRNAAAFAHNGGRPIRIVRYQAVEVVEVVDPEGAV